MNSVPSGLLRAAAIGTVACWGLQAPATTITFDSWSSTDPVASNATVSVNDDTAGVLTFLLTLPFQNALLSGFWIDLVGDPSYDITFSVLTAGVGVDTYVEDDNNLGNGRNLNGNFAGAAFTGPSGTFDIGLGFEDGEAPPRQVPTPLSFTLESLGGTLTLADIARIALRFQSVGEEGVDGLGDGSEKLIGLPNDPSAVPLPATALLLIAGLGGLAAVRRRKA